jgi:hypothetical protein
MEKPGGPPRPPDACTQTAWEDADKFCSTLCIPFDETTTEQHLRHHLQEWRLRQTPKLLRLKLHCIWTWRFFFYFLLFILFYFILFIYIFFSFIYFLFLFLYLFFLFFYFQSSLCLSNAFSAYGWLLHFLSLFMSLKLLLFVSLFCFLSFYLIICFSFFL